MNDNQKILHFPARVAHLDICHNCTHGGDMVMKCNCPELQGKNDWAKISYPMYHNSRIVRRLNAIVEMNRHPTFSATPYLAVVEAVYADKCKFFEAIR